MNTEAKLQEVLDLGQARGFHTEVRNNEVTVNLVTPAEFLQLKHRPVAIQAVISTRGRKKINFYQVGNRTSTLTRTEALDIIRNVNI